MGIFRGRKRDFPRKTALERQKSAFFRGKSAFFFGQAHSSEYHRPYKAIHSHKLEEIRMAKKKTMKKAAKKTAKKAGAKKATKKAASKRKPSAAFMKPLTPSTALAAIVGAKPLPRTEVVKKLWAYIRKNNLQDAKNRRMIHSDDKLRPVFGGKGQLNMFEMTKYVSKHLS
jgi:upstream activation factor subunit UAF30